MFYVSFKETLVIPLIADNHLMNLFRYLQFFTRLSTIKPAIFGMVIVLLSGDNDTLEKNQTKIGQKSILVLQRLHPSLLKN